MGIREREAGGKGREQFCITLSFALRLLTSHGAMVKGCLICIYREKKKVCAH